MEHRTSKFTQGLNIPVLAVIGIVGTLVVWVTVVGTHAYYERSMRAEEQVKLIAPEYLGVDQRAAAREKQQLTNVANVDEGKRAVIARFGGE